METRQLAASPFQHSIGRSSATQSGAMEAAAVSAGMAVLDGALGYAKSKAAEEIALQLGIDGDVAFITDELEMMRSFLMAADEERDQNKVLTTWVKQIRDLAYNVEDSLMDFGLQSELQKASSWCIPRNPCDRRRIAKEVKELKAKVEEVSSRNLRYRLIKGSGPKASDTGAAMFGIDEAWRSATELEKSKLDLHQLITSEAVDLRVIAVWGTCGDLGKTSEIRKAYDAPTVNTKFGCHAWVRVVHPFNPKEFLGSLVRQFYENSPEEIGKTREGTTVGANVLSEMKKMEESDSVVREFNAKVSSSRYLIVINDLSTIEEWDYIKTYFPDSKNRSRIIVSTRQVEIATLCTEQPYQVSELKRLPYGQILYLFHKKVDPAATNSAKPISMSSSANATGSSPTMSTKTTTEIQVEGEQPKGVDGGNVVPTSTVKRELDRSKTMAAIAEDPVGRRSEKAIVIDLIGHPNDSQGCKVISVLGKGGIGKTTLVENVYRSQELGGWKRAWATASPFSRDILVRSLASQLEKDIQQTLQLKKDIQQDLAKTSDKAPKKKDIGTMGFQDVTKELSRLLKENSCLIVLDDLSSTKEWDSIRDYLAEASRIIVTTRENSVAEHCSKPDGNVYSLPALKHDDALDLLKKKVFKDTRNFDLPPGMLEQAELILEKCGGLPLEISTIGGLLANKPNGMEEVE